MSEIPQAVVRSVDSGRGVVVLSLSGKTCMIALRTADGGKTCKEKSIRAKLGAPDISRDGKFVAVNRWVEGGTVLKYA